MRLRELPPDVQRMLDTPDPAPVECQGCHTTPAKEIRMCQCCGSEICEWCSVDVNPIEKNPNKRFECETCFNGREGRR